MAENQYRYDEEPTYNQEEEPSYSKDEGSAPAPRRKSGCGGKIACGCVALIFVMGGCTAAMIGGVFWMLTQSEAYSQGLSMAQQDPRVQSALGTPIEAGFLVEGNVSIENDGGEADLTIPISGPNGSANVYIEGTKKDGVWTFHKVHCVIDGSNETIDLLAVQEAVPEG